MANLMRLIETRKSVRTYSGEPLTPAHREKIGEFIKDVPNPFGIPVTFSLLDPAAHELSSPVLSGEPLYVAARVKKGPMADAAFGYSFERLVLFAWSLGIGTVWIGGTMKRADFENALGLAPDEMMPCMSPLGYPARRRSVKEVMMRKGVRADDRKPWAELFFENDPQTPLAKPADPAAAAALEMVRLAPSAVNKQPWRVIRKDGAWHFYEKKDGDRYESDAVGDLQKVDLGIALCHFVLGLEDGGKTPAVTLADPGVATPADWRYIATVTANIVESL